MMFYFSSVAPVWSEQEGNSWVSCMDKGRERIPAVEDFDHSFLVQTDTSDTGLKVVLSQIFDGDEHPNIYIIWKLTPAE